MHEIKWIAPPDQKDNFDPVFMNEVASRVFRMSGWTGNSDFGNSNDNALVNSGQSRRKWTIMEQYAEEVDGMPTDPWPVKLVVVKLYWANVVVFSRE